MKKNKIFILVLIIFIVGLFFIKGLRKGQTFDDFLFLKLGSNGYTQKTNLNLIETVDKNTLINEKIAPGTSGEFSVCLYAKQNIDYELIFKSINEKPVNLKFITIKEDKVIETTSLEELSRYLSGKILENEQIEVKIKWYWNFGDIGNESNTDVQDTKDAQKISQYQFKIYAVAKKLGGEMYKK